MAEELCIVAQYTWTLYPKPGTSAMDEPFRVCKFKYMDDSGAGEFVASGNGLPELKDVTVNLFGDWVEKKGRTAFQVTSWNMVPPETKDGLVEYLTSLKCGIGKQRANAIYNTFGKNAWFILQNQPERLREIGLSTTTIKKVREAIQKTQIHGEIMRMFKDARLNYTQVDKLVQQFGGEALNILEHHPYQVCQVDGFGFRLMDSIALKRGIDPTNLERREAAVTEILDVVSTEGHVCYPRNLLVGKMVRLLNANLPGAPVTEQMCDAAITEAIANRKAATTAGYVYTIERYYEERRIVQELDRLLSGRWKPTDVEKIDECINKYEEENGIKLADSQRDAVRAAINNPVNILTGGPGTGKTTTIKAILAVHDALHLGTQNFPALLSPTGKAARRMSEATGFSASTIHSALGLGAKGYNTLLQEDEVQVLSDNIIIVDEFSMADQYTTCELLRAVPTGTTVVLVGDPDQLPSVGCGNVLYEFIRSKAIPTVKLSVIYRQAEGNPIVENSIRCRDGNPNLDFEHSSFSIKEESDPERIFLRACDMYLKSVAKYGLDSTVLLCPYRNASALSVNRFNLALQSVLNPPKPGAMSMKGKTVSLAANKIQAIEFRQGDKVMQTRNTESSKNGDVGYIKRMYMEQDSESGQMKATAEVLWNDEEAPVKLNAQAIRSLDLAYCSTVHKSQGSEYPNVIMVMSSIHTRMLRRNVFYTGITRARQNVLVVGERNAITKAILDDTTDQRFTLLGDRVHHQAKKEH